MHFRHGSRGFANNPPCVWGAVVHIPMVSTSHLGKQRELSRLQTGLWTQIPEIIGVTVESQAKSEELERGPGQTVGIADRRGPWCLPPNSLMMATGQIWTGRVG